MPRTVDLSRRALIMATACCLPAWSQPAGSTTQALTGRWRSLATSMGGIGSMMEFGPGNAFARSPGAVVEFAYRVDNDQLVLPPATRDGPEIREAITWTDRDHVTFRSTSPQDPGQTFVRQGEPPSSSDPLLGEWLGSRVMQGREVTVLRLFRAGGKALLLIPFLFERGTFSVAGDRITFMLPGKPDVGATVQVTDSLLVITTDDSKASRFERY
ncbi:hypothetical protein BH10PSE17_BH10PSE17_09140 [soil metagenome]